MLAGPLPTLPLDVYVAVGDPLPEPYPYLCPYPCR